MLQKLFFLYVEGVLFLLSFSKAHMLYLKTAVPEWNNKIHDQKKFHLLWE